MLWQLGCVDAYDSIGRQIEQQKSLKMRHVGDGCDLVVGEREEPKRLQALHVLNHGDGVVLEVEMRHVVAKAFKVVNVRE